MDTIVPAGMSASPIAHLIRALDPSAPLNPRMMHLMFQGVFGGRENFIAHGKETYVAMLDEVRRLVPKEQLLEYRMGEGWERLCAFLGKEVPQGEFPRVNEAKDFGERIVVMKRRALGRVVRRVGWWVAGVAVPVGGVLWFVYRGGA